MAEILTESFCERCGTRYTFESPARRSNPLGALGTMGRGLKNFVVSPDQSIDEAFAVARAEVEQRTTAHQLEAFHRTFNFCLSCRQYTCGDCWNPIEGRCQSCAPMPEAEVLPGTQVAEDAPVVAEAMAIAWAAAAPVLDAAVAEPTIETNDVAAADVLAVAPVDDAPATIDVVAWPVDGPTEPEARLDAEPEMGTLPELETAELDSEPAAPADVMAEPVAAAGPAVAGLPDWDVAAPPPVLGATEIADFPPGISLDDEIDAYDLRVAALADAPAEPSPVEPLSASRPEMTIDAPALTSASSFEATADAALSPRAAAEHGTAVVASAAPSDAPSPALPPIVVAGAVPDLPAASSAAMTAAQTTGSCPSCGLALSATARFCRRCGTAQAH